MAHYKLEEIEQSRAAMDRATQAIQQWIQQAYDGRSDAWVIHLGAEGTWPISHWEYLEFQLLYREARTLLGLKLDHDPRLHMLRGRALAGLRRSREADAEFTAARELEPDDPRIRLELHRNRGYLYSAMEHYDRAAEEFGAAAELRPDDSDLLRFRAVCHWLAGDFSAYRQVCRAMLAKFGQTQEPAIAYDVVDACVLRSDSISDMASLLPLADIASTWYLGAVRIRGAALCRAGQFEQSLRGFQDAQRFHRFRPWDWAFLAMNHHHLGHPFEASQCLANAQRWTQEADQQQLDDLFGERPSWGEWHERADAIKLMEEAKSLLHAPVGPNNQGG
jgi:tetratricopeptide (TPR) repeat protein